MNKMTKLKAIYEIIEDIRQQIQPQACGHLHTTVGVLESEASRLEKEIEQAVAS